jgi:hypothetical protein
VQSILTERERAAAAAKRAQLEAAAGTATVAPVDPYDRLVDELSQVDSPAGVVAVWQENRASIKDLPAETRARAWSEVQAAWSAYGGLDGVNGLTKAVLKAQPEVGGER